MTENIGHAKGTTGRVVTSFRFSIFTNVNSERMVLTRSVLHLAHMSGIKEKDFIFIESYLLS